MIFQARQAERYLQFARKFQSLRWENDLSSSTPGIKRGDIELVSIPQVGE